MKRIILYVLFLLIAWQTNAQQEQATLVFQPMWGTKAFELDREYAILDDILTIDEFRMYISGIRLLKNGESVWTEENSYHLLDITDPGTMNLKLDIPHNIVADELVFNLGIDSVTNAGGVQGGDLDPTKGMYWTWQSGYINFKLEGSSRKSTARHQQFQLHLGGYQYPNNVVRTISLKIKTVESFHVNIDLWSYLKGIDMASMHHVMSPGKEAMMLSDKAAKMFSLQQ